MIGGQIRCYFMQDGRADALVGRLIRDLGARLARAWREWKTWQAEVRVDVAFVSLELKMSEVRCASLVAHNERMRSISILTLKHLALPDVIPLLAYNLSVANSIPENH